MDLEGSENTEPPLTRDLPESEILSALSEPLILPPYPTLERMVKVVTESCSKRVGYNRWHRLILKLLESRNLVKKFNTKKHDAVLM